MSHGFGSHFLALGRHMEPMRSPCPHFPTCNKLLANQYQSWRPILVPIPLMRKSKVRLHLLSSIFKLATMSIRIDYQHWSTQNTIMKNFQKWNLHGILQTWHMMQIFYSLCNYNWEGEVLPIFGHQKMDKERNL